MQRLVGTGMSVNEPLGEIDFPSLQKSAESLIAPKPFVEELEGIKILIDPVFEIVSFHYKEKLIKLFKLVS